MPLPLILGLAAVGSIVGGSIAHLSAREKNELAESTLIEAKSLYDKAKKSLEEAKKNTEESLLNLGY